MKVFIFGSNKQGFHGAGTAGFAFRGDSANNWRTCPIMNAAMERGPGYVGLLAIYGQAEGLMQGTKGWSYAIPTVTRPGARRSISINDISASVRTLIHMMQDMPAVEWCLTPFGCGYAGYARTEMQPMYDHILAEPNARWATTVPPKWQHPAAEPHVDLT